MSEHPESNIDVDERERKAAFSVHLKRRTTEVATCRIECDSADEAEDMALLVAASPDALDWYIADSEPPYVIHVTEQKALSSVTPHE